MSAYVRPSFVITHVANPLLRRLAGFPALVVAGRRSGRLLTVPMDGPLELDGHRYLVSGRGDTHWVRNLRASNRAGFRLHSRISAFRPTEVFGATQASVVDAYRRKLGHRVDAYFEAIPDPAGHPVFRLDPIPA